MGFGYAGTFLVIFLTHPGVIIPSMTSVTSLLPLEAVPSGGFPPIMSALWQVFCAWVLGLGGSGSEGLTWTMYTLYLVFLFIYMYLFLRLRIEKGV